MSKGPNEVIEFAKSNKTEFIDIKFSDFPGSWQHFTLPANELGEKLFTEGLGFDGSSIRGWKNITESDMLVLPDPSV